VPAFLSAHTFYVSLPALFAIGIGLLVAAAEGREPPEDWIGDGIARAVVGDALGTVPFGADVYQAVRDGQARAPGAIGLYLGALADLAVSKDPGETFFDTIRFFGLLLGVPADWPATLIERRTKDESSRRGRARGRNRGGGRG
jgi:hypothetical protein